jgi:hypothetical protein
MAGAVRVRRVDDRGVTVSSDDERVVDVVFDDHRVWSFHVLRDTETQVWPGRLAAWPTPLRRYLDGVTRLVVRDAATKEIFFDDEIAFGRGRDRVQVVNNLGLQLGMDKSGQRLVPTFSTRGRDDIAGLLDAVQAVLEALRTAGAQPFVGYGTLLGAIREGAVLGHDNDADIAYVSDSSTPVDVIRESFRLQREVNAQGFETVRYSGAAFKILVPEADGFRRGLDVFGGFLDHGRLYLMGEVGVSFERDWLYPLGTAQLEGLDVPVPARPEKLLEAMYGPGWRTPDPAFKFETPQSTKAALNAWFRGLRPHFSDWQRRFALRKFDLPQRGPSVSARHVRKIARETGATVLDVGAGRGADSLWLARSGVPVIAYDYVNHQLHRMAEACRAEELPLEVRTLNLTEWRSWLSEGARLSRVPGPRIVLAQHVLDATTPMGQEGFARFCSMVCRDGGSVHAQFHTVLNAKVVDWSSQVDTDRVATLLREAGAERLEFSMLQRSGRPDALRLVAEWPT